MLACIGVSWFLYNRASTTVNPFNAQLLASIDFPLYYPTRLPAGYHLDTKTVGKPQDGVVVLTINGPKNQNIYMSQEIRPGTFDFGGYYNNFSDKKLIVTEAGTIAVGHIDNGYTSIGSLATSRTWVIVNTKASVDLNQLTVLLESLATSH
ncbi:MAG TPA: hypothetical protein VLG16_04535 [Candidatus Saccharimonadales bacterium]|nr:hypothetical protein [Candidatus Saccharimonadales bacterium]